MKEAGSGSKLGSDRLFTELEAEAKNILLLSHPCFKTTILPEICIKMCYFYWKIAKIAQRCGLRPQTPCLWRLRALPPAAALRVSLPDPCQNPPIENSWLRHWGEELKILESDREESEKTLRSTALDILLNYDSTEKHNLAIVKPWKSDSSLLI